MLLALKFRPTVLVMVFGLALAIAVACTGITDPTRGVPITHGLDGPPGYTTVTSVQLTLKAPSLIAGQTTQATAVAKDLSGFVLPGRTATWTSLNPSVATVSASGLVTAVAPGSATIRATVDSVNGDAVLSATPVPIANIAISLASVSVTAGQTTQANAVVTDSNGIVLTDRTLTWSSSNPAVATVSAAGLVTAVASGSAAIGATAEGHFGAAYILVPAPAPAAVAAVSVSLSSASLTVGQTTQAIAVARDSAGTILTGRSVSWTSLSPSVATVSSEGTVTAVAPGTATIRATVESKIGDAPLTVSSVPVATVSVTLASPSLTVGQTTQATAVALDASGSVLTDRVVAWSSLNTNIATVSPSGTVTAVASGSATIRATVETKTGDAAFTATSAAPIVSTVTVSMASQTLIVGGTTQATAIAVDANGNPVTGKPVTWVSAATSVATVSSTGLVTAVGAGSAAIQATVASKSGSASVNVTASSSVPVATVAVTLGSSSVTIGGGTQATAAVKDANGNVLTGRTVVWTSSAPTVASVSSTGVVSAIAAGTANIQATVDSKTGSAYVNVTASSPVPVATVAVTLGSSSLTTGGGTQATAAIKDANGNVLTGRTVVWTSSAPAVASVSSTGVVTAIAAGSASIQATVETKVGAAPLSVTAATIYVPSASHPHEPAGMTMLSSHDGSAVMPTGWFDAQGQISIVNDAQKGSALQLAMSPLTTPGSGTARIDSDPEIAVFGATKVYVSFWEKVSPTFQGNNGAGSLKNVMLKTQETYGGLPNPAIHLPALYGDATNPNGRIRPVASLVNFTDHDGRHLPAANNLLYYYPDAGEPGDPGDLFSRGTWHFLEAVWTMNSRGNADGAVQIWVDGVSPAPSTVNDLYINGLIGSGLKAAYDGTLRFTGIEITNVWGGGGTAIPADNWYRFKDVYVSGGYARAGERPDHWNLTVHEGYNPAAGTDVHVTAQLVDGNGNPVDICGPTPTKVTVTGGATWDYWNGSGVYAPYVGCEHGQQLYTLHTSTTPGTQHVISVEDYATVNNGAKGDLRTGTSQPIIVK